jgi:transcriptional regulator with XRE-family HTH domain
LTLREAEERSGVNKDTISRVERGVHAPHSQTVAKLAEAYGRTTEELLNPLALAQR